MPKQCVNNECNIFLEDNDTFCKMCGTPQPPIISPKKGFNLFKKKEDKIVKASIIRPEELQDFRLAVPQHFDRPKAEEKENPVLKSLERIEEKLDSMIENHTWMLICLDNFLQGYKKKSEKPEE